MSLGSCRVPTLPEANSVPMPPSMSPIPSPLVAPVRSESSWNSATCSIRCLPSSLSIAARSWKVSARSAGPPTLRAYDVISPRSSPCRREPEDLLAGARVEQRAALVVGGEPASGGVALELASHALEPIADRSVRKCGAGGVTPGAG